MPAMTVKWAIAAAALFAGAAAAAGATVWALGGDVTRAPRKQEKRRRKRSSAGREDGECSGRMQQLAEENEGLRRQLSVLHPARPLVLTRVKPYGYALPKLMSALNARWMHLRRHCKRNKPRTQQLLLVL